MVVLTDKESRNRGFTVDNERKLRDDIRKGLKDAASKPEDQKAGARDKVLTLAVDYVVSDLKGTRVTTTADGTPLSTKNDTKKAGGMGVGGWICLGLCILLGVWLIIGVIRRSLAAVGDTAAVVVTAAVAEASAPRCLADCSVRWPACGSTTACSADTPE